MNPVGKRTAIQP